MKQDTNSRYFYAILVVIISIAVICFAISGAIGDREVAGALMALLATFIGALFAFRLNEDKDKKKILKAQKAALNRALFVLLRQYAAVALFSKFLEPFETVIDRAINLPAHQLPPYTGLTQDVEALEFLLETDHANVLMRLTVEQECFYQALESVRLRNRFYVDEVQHGIALLGISGKSCTEEQLLEGLGERVLGSAINYANGVYLHILTTKESLLKMHQELYTAAKELFPNERFILPASDV